MLLIILFLCSMLVTVATLLPLTHISHWTVRGLDFPRLQILFFAFSIFLITILFLPSHTWSKEFILICCACCMLYHARWIIPYTPFYKKEVPLCKKDNDKTISILSSNVLMTNKNYDALLSLINEYNPDIIVTLESDITWQKELSVIENKYPFTAKCPLDNLYGMHVFSKLELIDTEIKYLVEKDIPSIHTSIFIHGEKTQLHFLHPAPPSPTENETSEERDAELILVAKIIKNVSSPTIVTGDLNDVAWSTTTRIFRKLSGLCDPRIGRGMFNTFHADYCFIRWPLDHLFHSKHFCLKKMKRLYLKGSDHFALFTTLALGTINYDHEKEHLSTQERELVNERLQEQNLENKKSL